MDDRTVEVMDSESIETEIINANPVLTLITTEDGIPTSTEVTVLTTTLGDVPMMTASLGTHPTFVTSHPGGSTVYATSITSTHIGQPVVVGEGQITVLDSDGVQRTIVVHASPNQLSALAQVQSHESQPRLISVELQDALPNATEIENVPLPIPEEKIIENTNQLVATNRIQEHPMILEGIHEVATEIISNTDNEQAIDSKYRETDESDTQPVYGDEHLVESSQVFIAVEEHGDNTVIVLNDVGDKLLTHSATVVSSPPIPEEVVCLVCYQSFMNPNCRKKESSCNENDINLGNSEKPNDTSETLYGRTLGRFFEISRINMSIVTRRSYKDYKVPICQKCNETLLDAERNLNELRRLEKELYCIRQRVKDEILTSDSFFKSKENKELAENRKGISGLTEILDVIDRIRDDIINDGRPPKTPRFIGTGKKPGRKPKKSANGGGEFTESSTCAHAGEEKASSSSLLQESSTEQSVEENASVTVPSPKDAENVDIAQIETKTEEDNKSKQPAFRTSFGRLVKRPTYMLTEMTDDELSDLGENSEDNYEEIEVKPELPSMETESGVVNEEEIDEEDPAWAPERGIFVSERTEILSSSSDESDNFTEDSDLETVPKIKTKKESKEKKLSKPRRYKRQGVNRYKRTKIIRQDDMNYEVKVIQLDGTELMTINTTAPNENIGLEPEITQKVMDSQAVIMVKNQLYGKRVHCHHCSRTFTDPLRRDIHVKKKHEGVMKPFECEVCRKRFSRHDHLRNHVKRHMRPPKEKSFKPKPTSSEKNQSCQFCDQKFRNKSELAVHTRTHTGEKPYKCEHCMEAFVSALKREFHIEQLHPEVPPLRCEFCQKGFFRQHRLRLHAVAHTGEKANICELCGKSFSQAAMLRYHQTTHEELNLKQFKCQECNRVFANPQNLKSHMESQHQKMYRHRCPHCDRGYTQMSHLRRHLRTHSGEQPFICSYCPKRFTSGAALKIHVRIHTGERPYWCAMCEKGFRSKTKLGRHLKTLIHSGENKDRLKKETVTSEVESVDVNAADTTAWTEIVGIITGV